MKTLNNRILIAFIAITTVTIIVSCGINKKIKTTKNIQVQSEVPIKPINLKQLNIISNGLFKGPQEKIFKDALRMFEFENQEIIINLALPEKVYENSPDIYAEEKFVAKTATLTRPKWDIIKISENFNYIAELLNDPDWAKHNLVDFSKIPEFIATTKPEILSDNFKNDWGGIVPGPAIGGDYYCLYYNKELATKIGISVKSQNMSIDDFESYLKALRKYNIGSPYNSIKPFIEIENNNASSIFSTQLFASLFTNKSIFLNEGYSLDKINKWHDVLIALEELAEYHIIEETNDNKNLGFQDNYLFYVASSSDFCKIIENKNNICAAQLPGIQSSVLYPIQYNITWAIPLNSPNKKQAIKFLLHMNTSDIAEQWVTNTKCPTGVKCDLNNLRFINNSDQDFSIYLNQKFENGNYNLKPSNARIFGSEFANVHSYDIEVLSGQISANEAMKKILETIESINNHLSFNN